MFSILWHWERLCWRKIGQFCNSHAFRLSKRKFNMICVYILMQDHCFLKCLKCKGRFLRTIFQAIIKWYPWDDCSNFLVISGSQEDSLNGWAKESGQDRPGLSILPATCKIDPSTALPKVCAVHLWAAWSMEDPGWPIFALVPNKVGISVVASTFSCGLEWGEFSAPKPPPWIGYSDFNSLGGTD